ncbi:Panacea domain-containing protein [Peribacillus sp. NPDC076916]|uniref:Panacea domain-containing protein n=1 Tax=Peribacillus sp. NPDC076916 TaxID=3390608 RepID=UPI003D0008D3
MLLLVKDILDIAASIKSLYTKILQMDDLTEMKMHKLLYYSQKKHFENFGTWLFNDDFEGWRHGPVNRKVRSSFAHLPEEVELSLEEEYSIRETIFEYGVYPAEVLSNMSHDEEAYKISRHRLGEYDRGNRIIKKEDIVKDSTTLGVDYSNECEVH